MRFACLLVEHLPVSVERLLDPDLMRQPLAILRAWNDRVLDATPDVITAGVETGDTRRRVEQLCPLATILPAREPLYLAHHQTLEATLAIFARAVETWSLGVFFIEIDALARTFESERALGIHLLAQAGQNCRLQPALGIAGNKFTSLQAAKQAKSNPGQVLVVPAGEERPFLAPLPLSALPDSPPELQRRLHLFGIYTLGGFARLPRPAVCLQFGSEVVFFHDLARGVDPRPLVPLAPPPSLDRTLTLPEPLEDRQQLLRAVHHLAGQVARDLADSGYQVVSLALSVSSEDGRKQSNGSSIRPPSAGADLLRRLAGRLLDRIPISSPVSRLRLTAYPLRAWHHGVRQLSLFDEPRQPRLANLHVVIQALQQRFGEAVIRLAGELDPPRPFPIRAHVLPDGAPVQVEWDGLSRRVLRVYETWREHRYWWDKPWTRDYYRIETESETFFVVFRDDEGRWYLDRRRE